MDYVRFLPLYPFFSLDMYGKFSLKNEIFNFFESVQNFAFVELDFRYLDYSKYKYLSKVMGDKYYKYLMMQKHMPTLRSFYNTQFARKFKFRTLNYLDNNIYLFNYWFSFRPSKRLNVMPWMFFNFNQIWLRNLDLCNFLLNTQKLYKYFPFNSKMPTLSYIDKYGSLFSRIDDFFEFNVNKFRFNFKFNNLFANSFNYIRFFYQMD